MAFQTYPEYKQSGTRWFDNIPLHWQMVRVKNVASRIGSGKTPLGGAQVYSDQGVLFLRSQNVHSEGLQLEDAVYIDDMTDAQMVSTRVLPEDILLNITGASLGRSSLVPPDIGPANVSQHVCIIRPIPKKVLPQFLHATIVAGSIQSQIFASEVGSSREGLNFSEVANLTFVMPPSLEEQGAIVHFLNQKLPNFDALITEKQNLIKLLNEKRNALICQAMTKGLNAAVPMKDSGIPAVGSIPAHWEIKRNKRIFREIDDRSETGEEELLTVSHITGITPRSEKEVNMFMAESLEGYKRCGPGDLVINTMWAWMGALGITKYAGIVSPSYNVYRLTEEYTTEYLDLLYRTPAYICEITRFSKGVWTSRLRLYPDAFFAIDTITPALEEQAQIVQYIKQETADVENLIRELEDSIRVIQEYRSALITAAVTGQIDVRSLHSVS